MRARSLGRLPPNPPLLESRLQSWKPQAVIEAFCRGGDEGQRENQSKEGRKDVLVPRVNGVERDCAYRRIACRVKPVPTNERNRVSQNGFGHLRGVQEHVTEG